MKDETVTTEIEVSENGLTKEQNDTLARLKKTHATVYVLAVERENGAQAVAFLKPPQRNILNFYLAKVGTEMITANEVLLNSIWLEGDEEIKTNDSLFLSAIPQLGQMMNIKQGSLRKF